MEELLERIRQLEHENEILKVKIEKNSGDCDQLWTVTRLFIRPTADKGVSFRKLKLGKGSFATVLVSLALGLANVTFKILQFFDLI